MQREPLKWSIRTEFHLGIGVDRWDAPISKDRGDLIATGALALVCEEYEGASMVFQEGGWTNPERKLIMERGITIVAYGFSNQMTTIAKKILALADQRAMIVATIGDRVSACEVFAD